MKRGERKRRSIPERDSIWTPTNYSGDGRKSRHTHVKHIQHKTVRVPQANNWNQPLFLKLLLHNDTEIKKKTYVEMLFQLLCCLIKSKTCCCWCWWRLFSSLWLEDRATAMVTSMIACKSGTNQFTRLRHGAWRWLTVRRGNILAPGPGCQVIGYDVLKWLREGSPVWTCLLNVFSEKRWSSMFAVYPPLLNSKIVVA